MQTETIKPETKARTKEQKAPKTQTPTNKTWNLMELTSNQVAEILKKTDVVLIPTGSCERHGHHLPLGCDSFQALTIASRAATRA